MDLWQIVSSKQNPDSVVFRPRGWKWRGPNKSHCRHYRHSPFSEDHICKNWQRELPKQLQSVFKNEFFLQKIFHKINCFAKSHTESPWFHKTLRECLRSISVSFRVPGQFARTRHGRVNFHKLHCLWSPMESTKNCLTCKIEGILACLKGRQRYIYNLWRSVWFAFSELWWHKHMFSESCLDFRWSGRNRPFFTAGTGPLAKSVCLFFYPHTRHLANQPGQTFNILHCWTLTMLVNHTRNLFRVQTPCKPEIKWENRRPLFLMIRFLRNHWPKKKNCDQKTAIQSETSSQWLLSLPTTAAILINVSSKRQSYLLDFLTRICTCPEAPPTLDPSLRWGYFFLFFASSFLNLSVLSLLPHPGSITEVASVQNPVEKHVISCRISACSSHEILHKYRPSVCRAGFGSSHPISPIDQEMLR